MSLFNHSRVSISVIAIFTCILLLADNYVEANENEAVSASKIDRGVGHIMNIYYCDYCSLSSEYRKVFDDYAGIISQKYPDISVIGANYDPPGLNMYLSTMIRYAITLPIMCILSGLNIFAWFNKPQPAWWSWCLENKLWACLMMFFSAQMLEGQLVSSGAFEIYLDSIPLWSKLETGRMPQPPELFQIIDNTLQFSKMDMPKNFAQ